MAKFRKSAFALGAGLAALLGYHFIIRPWSFHWGATPSDVHTALPGDELLSNPMRQMTRSIAINAPAAAVWPWLVQMGFGRASWYTYQFLEKILRLSGEIGMLNGIKQRVEAN